MSKKTHEFLEQFYQAIDSREPAQFSRFFANEGEFIFGNYPPSRGRTEIEFAAQGVFDVVNEIRHEIKTCSVDSDGRVLMEGRVRYVKKNGAVVEVPFASGLALDRPLSATGDLHPDSKIRHYQAYVDLAPLWSA